MARVIVKSPEQIDGIRKSCQLAAKALQEVGKHVVPGASTAELDSLLEKFIRDHGAVPAPLGYRGYPKATCISVNEVICHGIPGRYRLREGDILNVDVTTILGGYYGDTSRMFVAGSVGSSPRRFLRVAEESMWVGIRQVRHGQYLGRIGLAIQRYVEGQGFSVVRAFCGHGVGLEFHEEPQVPFFAPVDQRPLMVDGMIFTIEPMINEGTHEAVIDESDGWTARTKDGRLSAQYEHTVLVRHGGCEVLTELKEAKSDVHTA